MTLADGTVVKFENYPPAYIEFWQLRGGNFDVDQFVVKFKQTGGGDGSVTGVNVFEFKSLNWELSTWLGEDIFDTTFMVSFSCSNAGTATLVTPRDLRTPRPTPEPTPTPPGPTPTIEEGPTAEPTPTLAPGGVFVPGPSFVPATAAPVAPGRVNALPGRIRMEPEPVTRLRPDSTQFFLEDIVVGSSGPDAALDRYGVNPDYTGEGLVGPVMVTHTYRPQEQTTRWNFGDGEGTSSGSYRATYLYPRTSRNGTTTVEGLPAFEVTAELRWAVDVRIDWNYRETHPYIREWSCAAPRIDPGSGRPLAPVCTPVWDTYEEVHPGSRTVPNAGEVTTRYSVGAIVVETSIVDGSR